MTKRSFTQDDQLILKKEKSLFSPKQISSATFMHWSMAGPFPTYNFKSLYFEYVICDNLDLQQSVSS